MKSMIVFFIFFFLSFLHAELLANIEKPHSLTEMAQRSSLIVDGEIIKIFQEEIEVTPVSKGDPVRRIKYKAIFKIDNPLQCLEIADLDSNSTIDLVFWKTTDARYRGDKVPELKVGDKFRLYAEAGAIVRKDSGEIAVFVHNANAIRPESYHSKSLTEPATLPLPK